MNFDNIDVLIINWIDWTRLKRNIWIYDDGIGVGVQVLDGFWWNGCDFNWILCNDAAFEIEIIGWCCDWKMDNALDAIGVVVVE